MWVMPAGTGSNLTASSSGAVAGSLSDTDAQALAVEIAENEIAHVRYLRKALGSSAVSSEQCFCKRVDHNSFCAATAVRATLSVES